MFRMIEVVGTSREGFSAAVRSAVEQLTAAGNAIHFFEVVEQRGAVRDGVLREYQVKLKVAVAAEPAVQPVATAAGPQAQHVCPTCMQPAGEHGHLCVPVHSHDETCDWCGALIPDERHLCNDKVRELAYICNSCGRTAVSADHLCNPVRIPGK